MGLFSRSRSLPSLSIEEQLEAVHGPIVQALCATAAEAQETLRQMLFEVKEEAVEEGTDQLPSHFGDLLLEHETSDPTIQAMLTDKRRQGVTDEDLRSWWNQHDYERRLALKIDDLKRMATYVRLRDQGFAPQDASQQALRSHVCYGDPNDAGPLRGDDRPLPPELRERIQRYTERRLRTDPKRYRQELVACSSLNAHIRLQMRKGNLY